MLEKRIAPVLNGSRYNIPIPKFKTHGSVVLTGEERERLLLLCEQAVKEQDSHKLLGLVREINDLLDAKKARLEKRERTPGLGQDC